MKVTRAARQFSNKLSAAHGEQSLLTNETECFSFHTKLQCCYLNNNGNAAVRANFSTNSRMGHWSGWCRRFLSGVDAAGNQTTVNLSTHSRRSHRQVVNTTTFVRSGSLRFTVTMISKIRPLSTLAALVVGRADFTNESTRGSHRTDRCRRLLHTSMQVPELRQPLHSRRALQQAVTTISMIRVPLRCRHSQPLERTP